MYAQEEVHTCGTNFDAVESGKTRMPGAKARIRRQVTGVTGIKCARHAIVEKVCDLHNGERYEHYYWMIIHSSSCSYMYTDYVIMECLRQTKLKNVAFTYDIWCKFEVNLAKRIMQCFSPKEAGALLNLERRGFIPKLHLYAHGQACATIWSLVYHHGIGRTDGESTERDWASAVLAALQTSEMNPEARHAVLDDHWMDKNFQRVLNFSTHFMFQI